MGRATGLAMNASLMTTCLGDARYPTVGAEVERVLTALGRAVDLPVRLTWCGQAARDSGCRDAPATCVTPMTGPSASADSARGHTLCVHGSGEVYVWLIDNE